MPFTAEEAVAPDAAAFLWNARVSVFPGIHLRVLDSLLDARGSGQVSFMSAIRLESAAGTHQMNSGSLHRFLAEAVWYPTALLPGERLHWTAIDGTKALATLADGDTSVSLEFRFNAAGEVVGVYSPGRWGRFDGEYHQKAWEGHFSNDISVNGMLIPRYGEVGWYDDRAWRRVWEGTIVDAKYDFRVGADYPL